jgi:Tol biopolymer transport system component
MQRITWYGLLAVVALTAPIAGRAQAPQAQVPKATVRELATIEGGVRAWVLLPDRRTLVYESASSSSRVDNSTFAYDIATKRRTLLGTNMIPRSVSPQGDRLAFRRSSEDRTGVFVWTMPIDPKTGMATGQAQRVSLRQTGGGHPVFSPDGKILAFYAGPRPDGTWDVTLVPATGGAERIVANYPEGMRLFWSADGQSLYVERTIKDSPGTFVERVPVAGGQGEPWVPRTLISASNTVEMMGFSPDARVAFYEVEPDRFFYRTASGIEGEISVPLPPLDDGFGSGSLDSTLRYTQMTDVFNQVVRVLDLNTGQAHDLLPGNVQSAKPAWSPDGRRLAVLTGNWSHYDITVVNADGSSPRRYSMPMHLAGWSLPSVWEMPWSPDGRFLAFRVRTESKDRQNYNGYQVGSLGLLDVQSGQTRVLTSSATIGNFVWRSDGKAIRALKRTVVPAGTLPGLSIVEIELNGTERRLRDISAEFPNANVVVFASDRTAVARVPTDQSTQPFLVPLDGGAARRLPDPGAEPRLRRAYGNGTLVAGNQVLFGMDNPRCCEGLIKIVSTVGEATRTLRLPFRGSTAVVTPDGQHLINSGKTTSDSPWKLFLVPLDGSATRLITEIPTGNGGLLAPSPDGKLLAYTSDGIHTSKIHEIDFGPALQAIVNR